MVGTLCHPSVCVPISAQIPSASDAPNNTLPSTSIAPACGLRDSLMDRCTHHASTAQTGRFNRKTQRQPTHCVITPPTSGATVVARPMHMPHTAHARARSGPSWKLLAMTASAAVSSIDAPTPFTARAIFRISAVGASPHPSDARKNTPRPIIISFLRPKRSAMPPAASRQDANATI